FNPNIVTAPNGTVVSFVFSGIPGNHSVTQSSFATPCQPLPRGFDSSFIAGREIQGGRFPTWTLTVTNDQNSMWFYCKQVIPSPSEFPTSHCNAGMVGVINVQAARNSFSDFQAKAEQSSTGTATAPSGCLVCDVSCLSTTNSIFPHSNHRARLQSRRFLPLPPHTPKLSLLRLLLERLLAP
ncbi:hypothetical protein B0H10DRAFT_1785471, partial [Mycena sp. CBHHK59/15]